MEVEDIGGDVVLVGQAGMETDNHQPHRQCQMAGKVREVVQRYHFRVGNHRYSLLNHEKNIRSFDYKLPFRYFIHRVNITMGVTSMSRGTMGRVHDRKDKYNSIRENINWRICKLFYLT